MGMLRFLLQFSETWSIKDVPLIEVQEINSGFYLAFAVFVLVYVPKLVLLVFMFGEDVFRLFEAGVNYFVSKSDESSTLFSSQT